VGELQIDIQTLHAKPNPTPALKKACGPEAQVVPQQKREPCW